MSPTIRQLIDPTGERHLYLFKYAHKPRKIPTEPEIDATVTVLSEAFNYAVFKAELGGDGSLVPVMLKAYVAEVETKGIDRNFLAPFRSEAQHNAGWDELMQRLDKKYTAWWDYYFATYDAGCEKHFGAGFKLNAHHLQVFGVTPDYRKQGIGSALVREVEDKLKSKHIPMCVETRPGGVRIYESMGFVVQGSETMQGATGEDFVYCFLAKHL
ncbi:hypothetical protein K439DRAFT_1659314 [Ramaria rubella]|nr:hypothetical protein K439DRAFT_1659314 [Ramaria rubella]